MDIVILAGGCSSRMHTDQAKFLFKLADKPIIRHIIDKYKELNIKNIFVVTSKQYADNKYFYDVNTIIQQEPNGTGGAILTALPYLKTDYVIVQNADTPLIETNDIKMFIENKEADSSLIVSKLPENFLDMPYGRVFVDSDSKFNKIIEFKELNEYQCSCNFFNTGIYKFKLNILNEYIQKLSYHGLELYLTDIFEILKTDNKTINIIYNSNYDNFHGINTMQDLVQAENIIQKRLINKLLSNGVYILDPSSIYLSQDTNIEANVTIEPNVVFKGHVRIGQHSIIKSFSYIEDSNIMENVVVGPFARLRGNNILQDEVEIGNFVELKNSYIGEKSKIKHLSYIGDTVMGIKNNIGAGTITCNYDGVKKFKTTIEDNIFIGANSTLIAPINIGSNSLIGAGSTINMNIDKEDLAIARARQKNIKKGASKIWEKKGILK